MTNYVLHRRKNRSQAQLCERIILKRRVGRCNMKLSIVPQNEVKLVFN
jgi:hypothetical protein